MGCVAFSPDGQRIVSGSADTTVRLWDAATGRPVGQPLTGHTDPVWSVAFSPDGKRIASGSQDQTVRLWDAATGKTDRRPADRPRRPGGQRGVQPRRPAHRLRRLGQLGAAVGRGHRQACRPAADRAHRPGRQRGVQPRRPAHRSGSHDKTVRLWDAATGQPIGQLTGHTDSVGQRGVSAPTASASPPAVTTRRCGCGTRPPESRSASR